MYAPIRRRFIILNCGALAAIMLIVIFITLREKRWDNQGIELANHVSSLSLAVNSLRQLQVQGKQPDYLSMEGFKRLTGGNDKRKERLLNELHLLDVAISELRDNKRITTRCYLDLNELSRSIDASPGLFGSRWEIALNGISKLRRSSLLEGLEWRDDLKPAERRKPEWQVRVAELPKGILKEKNPWGALYGRVFVQEKGCKELLLVSGRDAGQPAGGAKILAIEKLYPDLLITGQGVIEQELAPYLNYDEPKGMVERGNRFQIGGKQVNVGYDVLLTIDPKMQVQSRILVERMLTYRDMSEATLMVMDVNTGEIMAAYGSDNSGREPLQGSIPYIFQLFPLASTSKILFAAALLENSEEFVKGSPGAKKHLASLPQALKRSDTAWFQKAALDFNGARFYTRQAHRFGWNDNEKNSLEFCFGSGFVNSPREFPLAGRILMAPTGGRNFTELSDGVLQGLPTLENVNQAIKAHKVPNGVNPRSLSTARMVHVQVAGQGDSRTSAWGELLMLAHVARAANGQKDVPLPHLIRRITNVKGKQVVAAYQAGSMPTALSTDNARMLAGYLTQVNAKVGTAGADFQRVFGRFATASDHIFAKTGTTDSERSVPYKLYVAGFSRGKDGKEYDTALVAVIKRKKLANGSYTDGNRAAEMGLEFIRQVKQ